MGELTDHLRQSANEPGLDCKDLDLPSLKSSRLALGSLVCVTAWRALPTGTTAFKFAGRTAVYRWNLFDHPRGPADRSTMQEKGHQKTRDSTMMRCWDMAISTLIPGELFDFPKCEHHVLSPCSSVSVPLRADWTPRRPTSAVAARWFGTLPPAEGVQFQPHGPAGLRFSVSIAGASKSCTEHCRRMLQHCSRESMAAANHVPTLFNAVGKPSYIMSSLADQDYHPSIGLCDQSYTLRSQAPECTPVGAGHHRLCGCER